MRFFSIAVFSLLLSLNSIAQPVSKPPLTHEVYDNWKGIRDAVISNDGKWVVYSINPQKGDAFSVLHNTIQNSNDTIHRGAGHKFTNDSRFLAMLIKPQDSLLEQARKDKKKRDEFPRDSLLIINLSDGGRTALANIKSFQLPEEGNNWLAWLHEKPLPAPAAPKDTTTATEEEQKPKAPAKKKELKGTQLVILNLSSMEQFIFNRVDNYQVGNNAKYIAFALAPNDSVENGVFLFNSSTLKSIPIIETKGNYKQLSFDKTENQLAFIADTDTSDSKQRFWQLYLSQSGKLANKIADTAFAGIPQSWMVSENGNIYFSENGSRLFFNTTPIPPLRDTINDEDRVNLDIWHWNDDFLQSHQLKSLEQDKKRSYLAVYHIRPKRIVQLADLNFTSVTPGSDGNSDFAMAVSSTNYRREISWEWPSWRDVYVMNINTGKTELLLEKTQSPAALSPASKYLYYYDFKDSAYYAIDLKSRRKTNLSANITENIYNDLHDIPTLPWSYGDAGWTENDRHVLIYGKNDIWMVNATNPSNTVNLTNGTANDRNLQFRYLKMDPTKKFHKMGNTLMLSGVDLNNRSSGFFSLKLGENENPVEQVFGPNQYYALHKASGTNKYIFRKGSFVEFPDLWVGGNNLSEAVKISEANPQQQEFNWGTVEKVEWIGADGSNLRGLLYKPEDFDPAQKYPMITYFYERNSHMLHQHYVPAPSASTVNIPMFVSNGYIIFVPDIVYRTGHPGQSAYDAVVPGVTRLLERPYIDAGRLGIQGQSWGGYQALFIITRTNLFKAAMAGAPVSNMISAYGGIRWTTGLSRMMQYEHGQSRIGGTLWEKPMLYYENSPLFYADRVETPIMIMSNDNDGAVPWYQGIEMFVALRRLDKPVWMLNYNNEQHNLMQRKNRKDFSVRLHQFFDYYLKDENIPVWMATGIPAMEKGFNRGLDLIPSDEQPYNYYSY